MTRIKSADATLLTERKSSAVSQALRAIAWPAILAADPGGWRVPATAGCEPIRIRAASNLFSRRKAYALAYHIYHRCGYVAENPLEVCVAAYDARPDTLTLLVENNGGLALGTMTLVFDSAAGLPCDEIYHADVAALRAAGCRLVEFARLAIADDAPNARAILQYLFNLSYAFARHGKDCSDLIIECTPRHALYYKRMGPFEEAGPERPCPRVNGTRGVLLRLRTSVVDSMLECFRSGLNTEGRHIHSYPFTPEEELKIVAVFSHQHVPITAREMAAFDICGAKEVAPERTLV